MVQCKNIDIQQKSRSVDPIKAAKHVEYKIQISQDTLKLDSLQKYYNCSKYYDINSKIVKSKQIILLVKIFK